MMQFIHKKVTALALPVAICLAGCDQSGQSTGDSGIAGGASSQSSSSSVAGYVQPDAGYLQGAYFELSAQGTIKDWAFTQHSSDISYSVTADDGVLSITRTGDEPWGKIRQSYKGSGLQPMLGKRLKFSADVKADFTSEWGEAMEPPALTVQVKGIRAGAPAMLGKSTLVLEKAPIANVVDVPFWQRYSVEFSMPGADEAAAMDLEVSFLMTEGGTMYIRGPSLSEVEETQP